MALAMMNCRIMAAFPGMAGARQGRRQICPILSHLGGMGLPNDPGIPLRRPVVAAGGWHLRPSVVAAPGAPDQAVLTWPDRDWRHGPAAAGG